MEPKLSKLSAVFALANVLTFLAACPAVSPASDVQEGSENQKVGKSTLLEENYRLYSIPFECTEGICLWWDLVPEVDSYRIYRYLSANEREFDGVVTETTNSNCIDKTALPNRIYYYRVALIKNGAIQKMTTPFVPAIFSSIGDNFEPNNQFDLAWNLEPGEYSALIYSMRQGQIQDSDHYSVRANSGIYSLTISFPEKNPAIKNLQLVYQGIALSLDCGGHEFYIDSNSSPYFTIEFNEESGQSDKKISYVIQLKSELPLF